MKKFALLLSLLPFNSFAEENNQDKQYSIGLGLGSMYSGVGANFSFVSENDLKYISAGCVDISSNADTNAVCGLGVGWIKTDLFGANSNKHGFGVYLSIVDNEDYTSNTSTSDGVEFFEHERNLYGAGVSYTYFMNGINQSGTTLGVSIHTINGGSEDDFGGFFQVGYQF